MEIQGCFVEGFRGQWLDLEPDFRLPVGDHPDEVMSVIHQIQNAIPNGITGLRVLTEKEVWTFHLHPSYGTVPRLVDDAGDVREVWPTLTELGGKPWVVHHVLPDGNTLPMCYVPPAVSFEMGDDESQTRQKVAVPGGFMAMTPTTVRQWNWFAAATGKDLKPVTVTENSGATVDLNDHPVTEVSYWDSCEFARWAGVGLPTEEEWERAARGDDSRKYPWGNETPTDELCWGSITTQKERTAPCLNPDGTPARPKGASPYGLLDMSGNVWEWTSTVHK
jgi:formylglycine-generating enzyme required for sulfatase activity